MQIAPSILLIHHPNEIIINLTINNVCEPRIRAHHRNTYDGNMNYSVNLLL